MEEKQRKRRKWRKRRATREEKRMEKLQKWRAVSIRNAMRRGELRANMGRKAAKVGGGGRRVERRWGKK